MNAEVASLQRHGRNPSALAVARFRAVGCSDASSLGRDGQLVYAMNMLETADGRPLCEVEFEDGTWMLADPELELI